MAVLIWVARTDMMICRARQIIPPAALVAAVILIAGRFFNHVG
jgi:hypothetical protein